MFLQTNVSLQQSSSIINIATQDALEDLKSKLAEPASKFKAEEWLPVAQQIQQFTFETVNYIRRLQDELRKLAGLGVNGSQGDLKPSKNAVGDFFIRDKKARELFRRLQLYKESVLKLNDKLRQEFSPHTILINKELDSSSEGQSRFERQYFNTDNVDQVVSILNSLENNVYATAYKYITFCNLQVGSLDGDSMFDSFEALIGQNAQVLKAGNDLEIMAGLGSFNRSKVPEIIIGGKNVPLNERGYVVYKMKTLKKSGVYSVPVQIRFVDQDGRKQERTFDVEYTLVESK